MLINVRLKVFFMMHNFLLACMVGIIYMYIDTIFTFSGNVDFLNPFFLLAWMLKHDCLDTCCFGMSYMHVLYIFVFALVQCS